MNDFARPRVIKDHAYAGQSPAQTMDIYLPGKQGPADAVLYIHGGSWTAGDKAWHADGCLQCVKRGCAAATMNYRLLNTDLPADRQPASWEDMLDDIGRAIAALRDTLVEQGCPPRRLALSGVSAGGHLCLLYAYSRRGQSVIPIAFLFPDVGPTDFTDTSFLDYPAPVPEQLLGLISCLAGQPVAVGEISGDTPVLRAMSPIAYVDAAAPPTLLRYAAKDEIVPPSQGERLKAALDAAGVRNDLFICPHSGHGLDRQPEALARAYEKKLEEYFAAYFS